MATAVCTSPGKGSFRGEGIWDDFDSRLEPAAGPSAGGITKRRSYLRQLREYNVWGPRAVPRR